MNDKFNILGRINSLSEDKVAITDDQILCVDINKKLNNFISTCIIAATDVEIDNFKQNNPNTSQVFFCIEAAPASDYIAGTIYFYNGATQSTQAYSNFSRIDGESPLAPSLLTNINFLSGQDIYIGSDLEISYTYTSMIEAGGTLYIILNGSILRTESISESNTTISNTITISNTDLPFGAHEVGIYAIDKQNHRSNVCSARIMIKNQEVTEENNEISE